jgi:hypothetical protein
MNARPSALITLPYHARDEAGGEEDERDATAGVDTATDEE